MRRLLFAIITLVPSAVSAQQPPPATPEELDKMVGVCVQWRDTAMNAHMGSEGRRQILSDENQKLRMQVKQLEEKLKKQEPKND